MKFMLCMSKFVYVQLMDFRILVSALSSSYNINDLLQEKKNTDFKVWLENEMLYENIIMSCYELIIMQIEFFPDVAIKVHKNNETKESTFQCHFHLPG